MQKIEAVDNRSRRSAGAATLENIETASFICRSRISALAGQPFDH
jgi:hypothetical protein